MKKFFITALLVFVGLTFTAQNLPAQDGEMQLYVNVGMLTDDQFTFSPFTWTAGVNMDINLGERLMLSPECDVVFGEFKFDAIWLAPGALLNFKMNTFFFGGGICKWFKLTDNVLSSDLQLKLNAGFKSDRYRLVFYLETPFKTAFDKYMVMFGVSIGMAF